MVTALYPGSYDPVTVGHVDIVARAAKQFEKLVVAVYETPSKSLLFSTDEREQLMKDACKHIPNVEVTRFSGLVVRYAKDIGAGVIVRGLRSGSDFEYEFQLADMNRKLAPEVESVFLTPTNHLSYISSSLIREIASLGGDISEFVDPAVAQALKKKFSKN